MNDDTNVDVIACVIIEQLHDHYCKAVDTFGATLKINLPSKKTFSTTRTTENKYPITRSGVYTSIGNEF